MDIEITRGDTARFKFARQGEGGIIYDRADKLYFSVKSTYSSNTLVLQKTIDDMTFNEGYYSFVIEPSDTDNLEYKEYVYDIEVITDTYKQTIAKGKFIIDYEVTFVGDEN